MWNVSWDGGAWVEWRELNWIFKFKNPPNWSPRVGSTVKCSHHFLKPALFYKILHDNYFKWELVSTSTCCLCSLSLLWNGGGLAAATLVPACQCVLFINKSMSWKCDECWLSALHLCMFQHIFHHRHHRRRRNNDFIRRGNLVDDFYILWDFFKQDFAKFQW